MKLRNKRCTQILKILLENKDTITGDSLAFSVGVSSRTIRNDIKDLNSILQEYGAEAAAEIGQGYCLKVKEQERFQEFLQSIEQEEREILHIIPSEPEDRVRYIMSKLLLSALDYKKKVMDSFDLEEELFISTSTLKKDYRTIDKILKKYDLKISITKKNGVRIVGEEAKIRYCISEFIFNGKGSLGIEDNPFYKSVFAEQEMEKLHKILLECISGYNLRLTDIAFKNVLVHSLIMLKRFEHQEAVTYEKNDIDSFEATKEFECAKDIILRMKKEFQVDLGKEVYYLTQHLISSQRFLIEDPKEDYEHKEEIGEILQNIKEETNIDLSDDKQLINGLAMHLSAALQRLRFDMNIRNEFLDSIKNSYPLAFELAVLASEVIEKKHHLRAKENEIGFLGMHFGAALERKGLNRQLKRKKVIIVCIAGVATAMLLKEKIQRNFGHKIEVVKACPSQEVSQELIDQVDLVLTTVELPQFQCSKIKKISLFLEQEDLDGIQTMLDGEGGHRTYNYRDIFRKELFFTEIDFKEKNQVLEYITNIMLDKGYISESVKQSIFKREEMATTELGGLVAIPHALLNDMEEAVVSVLILKKPITWVNERVQVVLLLNIPKSKYGMWEEVFKRLYQYLIGHQGVAKLIKNQGYEEFIQNLEKVK